MGYPGVLGYEQVDVDTLVGWGADYIKLDGCYVNEDDMDDGKYLTDSLNYY